MENLDYENELQKLQNDNEMVEKFIEDSKDDKEIDNELSNEDLETLMLITQEAKTSEELSFFFDEQELEEFKDE